MISTKTAATMRSGFMAAFFAPSNPTGVFKVRLWRILLKNAAVMTRYSRPARRGSMAGSDCGYRLWSGNQLGRFAEGNRPISFLPSPTQQDRLAPEPASEKDLGL